MYILPSENIVDCCSLYLLFRSVYQMIKSFWNITIIVQRYRKEFHVCLSLSALKTFLNVCWRNFCFLKSYLAYFVFPPLKIFFSVWHLTSVVLCSWKPVVFLQPLWCVKTSDPFPNCPQENQATLGNIKIVEVFSKY